MSMALTPVPADAQKDSVVYHNATIHIGNGQVLENATIAFDKGKITRIGHFRMAWQKTDIDLKGKHVYPGLILPLTSLGLTEIAAVKATRDARETGQNNANVRSIIAYNTDSEIIPTLRYNGVLLAQPTPQGGLVSGLSSIVQLDAWNWQDATVVTDDAVHVNWPNAMRSSYDFASSKVVTKKNKSYKKQVNVIKSLFEDAKASIHKQNNKVNLKLDAVSPVFSTSRRVYINARSPKAIIASINYFQSIGVKNLVLVVGQDAEPVIGFIKQSGIPVLVSSIHKLPKRNDSSVDDGYTIAIKLHNAGVMTAIAYTGGMGAMSGRNLAFTAGTLVSYGLKKEQALQMITSNTAKILGIDKNYGTLEVGKSATFFITQGDALDMSGNVLSDAYIDGRKLKLNARQQELNQRFLKKYDL